MPFPPDGQIDTMDASRIVGSKLPGASSKRQATGCIPIPRYALAGRALLDETQFLRVAICLEVVHGIVIATERQVGHHQRQA
jgi:hypothetical protein